MTKADIVANIAEETGLERAEALRAVEAFMNNIKASMADGKNVPAWVWKFCSERTRPKNGS